MSNYPNDPGHGDSPAAWTAVTTMLVGVAAGTLFFFLNLPILVWLSAAFTLLGLIIGFIMKKAGYGVNGPKYKAKSHS